MNSSQDLLQVTAFFSALLHVVVILGVTFTMPDIGSSNNEHMLDVVLINQSNEEKPVESENISSTDNLGGGSDDREASSPLPYEMEAVAPTQSIKKTSAQSPQNTITRDEMLTVTDSELRAEQKPREETRLRSAKPLIGKDKVTTPSQRQIERRRLIAKINKNFEEYQKRPRKEFLSPSTKQHVAAEYLDKWRRAVEEEGNTRYPQQLRQRGIHGTVILAVEIRRNGTIHSVKVTNRSSSPLLDEAAIKVVRSAGPYEPFPEEINEKTDILVITRTFHFLRNNRMTSSDASERG